MSDRTMIVKVMEVIGRMTDASTQIAAARSPVEKARAALASGPEYTIILKGVSQDVEVRIVTRDQAEAHRFPVGSQHELRLEGQ